VQMLRHPGCTLVDTKAPASAGGPRSGAGPEALCSKSGIVVWLPAPKMTVAKPPEEAKLGRQDTNRHRRKT
jgi:hypothetical protein